MIEPHIFRYMFVTFPVHLTHNIKSIYNVYLISDRKGARICKDGDRPATGERSRGIGRQKLAARVRLM
jgi:hypothetical protein